VLVYSDSCCYLKDWLIWTSVALVCCLSASIILLIAFRKRAILVENFRSLKEKAQEASRNKGFVKIVQESDDEDNQEINYKHISHNESESDENDFDKHFTNFHLSSFT